MRKYSKKKVAIIFGQSVAILLVLLFGLAKMKIILWEGDSFESITISNNTETTQDVKFLINENYPVGSFKNLEELARYVIAGTKTDEDAIRKIYDYFNDAHKRFCSNGSHIGDVHLSENIVTKLFSYPFACCSDVNPALMQTYNLLGYDAQVIGNPRHVFGEVKAGDKAFVVDADIGSFIPASFEKSQEERFDFPGLEEENKGLYESIFIDDAAATYFGPPDSDGFALNNLPTQSLVILDSGESITFYNKRNTNRIVTFPEISTEAIGDYVDNFSGVGNGTIRHNLKERIIEEEGGCNIYEFKSPYVIIEGKIDNLNPESGDRLYFSIDKKDWAEIEVKDKEVALNYRMFKGQEKEEVLDPGKFLDDWGGYSYRIYIEPNIINQEMKSRRDDFDFILYEDGVPLPYPKGPDVIREGGGQYVYDKTSMLLFSTPDNSDPRINGREYKIKGTTYSSFQEPFGRYAYYLKACSSGKEDLLFEDVVQVQTMFQYNKFLVPEKIKTFENLNPETDIEIEYIKE